MLTVKIYSQGECVISQWKTVILLSPDSPTWECALAELEFRRKEQLRPYKIIIGYNIDGSTDPIELLDTDSCYVTNEEGKTIESIKPPKSKD